MDIVQLVWCHTLHTIGPLLSAANYVTCCRVPLQALLCKQRVAVVDVCLSSFRIGNGGRKLLVTPNRCREWGPTVRAIDWFCDKPLDFSQFICFSPSPRRSCDDLIRCDPSSLIFAVLLPRVTCVLKTRSHRSGCAFNQTVRYTPAAVEYPDRAVSRLLARPLVLSPPCCGYHVK